MILVEVIELVIKVDWVFNPLSDLELDFTGAVCWTSDTFVVHLGDLLDLVAHHE